MLAVILVKETLWAENTLFFQFRVLKCKLKVSKFMLCKHFKNMQKSDTLLLLIVTDAGIGQ